MIEAGQVLQNRYEIQKQIGEGGMGTVYIAVDRRFGSTVAIKETLFTDPNLRRAFEREAQLLNGLRHPALPRVSDHFTEGNGAFIVMEYIAGDDLAAMIEENGAFAVADVMRWMDELLDALDYLHKQKIPVVHRDIKPQNLKLTPRNEIVLLDFGLAKGSSSEVSHLSVTKSVFGYSRNYAPLEQIQGTGTDPRSDFYSLAATAFHLLTGSPPVDALTRATAVLNGGTDPQLFAHKINPKINPAISRVLHDAMALNSNSRPATAAKMRIQLADAANAPVLSDEYDGETLLTAPEDFSNQKTQIINDSDEAQTANVAAANLTNAQSNQQTIQSESEKTINNTQNLKSSTKPERPGGLRSLLSPMAVALAVLVLVGGGFAAWFARSSAGVSSNSAPPQSFPKQNNPDEPKIIAAPMEQTNNNSAGNNILVSDTNSNAAGKDSPTLAQSKKDAPKNNGDKNPANDVERVESPPEVTAGEDIKREVDKELEDLDKELENVGGTKLNKEDLKYIPPEIRSNDPRNPVDRAKLKIYIQKQVAEARRMQEINRRRAEQGLPAIKPPQTPSPKPRQTAAPPQTPQNRR